MVNVSEYLIKYANVPCVQWNYVDVFLVNDTLELYIKCPNGMTKDRLTTLSNRVRTMLLYNSDTPRMQVPCGVNFLAKMKEQVVWLYGSGYLPDDPFQ